MLPLFGCLLILSLVNLHNCSNVVVDLSHYNSVNFAQAKADGILGVIHKATQGTGYIDKTYSSRKQEAIKAGIKWGAYHFADNTDGTKQAQHFLKTVGDTYTTLLALDLEDNKGKTVTLKIAEDFVNHIKKVTNRYPLIYGNINFLKDMIKNKNSVLLNCPLWIARYPKTQSDITSSSSPGPVTPWKNWSLWQYTDGTYGYNPRTVKGIGKCDRDIINSNVHDSVNHLWNNAGR